MNGNAERSDTSRYDLINDFEGQEAIQRSSSSGRIQYIAFFRNSHPDGTTPRIRSITCGEAGKIPASKPTFNNGISSRAGRGSLIVETSPPPPTEITLLYFSLRRLTLALNAAQTKRPLDKLLSKRITNTRISSSKALAYQRSTNANEYQRIRPVKYKFSVCLISRCDT